MTTNYGGVSLGTGASFRAWGLPPFGWAALVVVLLAVMISGLSRVKI
jgi:hypothetical protein